MARVTQYYFTILKQFPSAALEVYTYGEPRVGNKYFADFINEQKIVTARAVARLKLKLKSNFFNSIFEYNF